MEKVTLNKKDRLHIVWRTTFLQGSWNFERMQNGGWAYAMIPAIRKLYPDPQEQKEALQRHLLFFNTHPYVASPIVGVALAMEEDKANGKVCSAEEIQAVKVSMMGPLAGLGDPLFWFSLRPLLAAIGAALAISGNIMGPIFFFVAWNVIRFAFMWYTQEYGYRMKTSIVDALSNGFLKTFILGASIVGVFIMGALVQRYVFVDYAIVFSNGISLNAFLDALMPGLSGLLLTLLCVYLLRKKVSPLYLIAGIFVFSIIGCAIGLF